MSQDDAHVAWCQLLPRKYWVSKSYITRLEHADDIDMFDAVWLAHMYGVQVDDISPTAEIDLRDVRPIIDTRTRKPEPPRVPWVERRRAAAC